MRASQWEAYPGHQFIHTIGVLPCCRLGGCWKFRTIPPGDKSKHDDPASEVIRRIEMFLGWQDHV
jgi:hypothetical protein